jgi:hypothetical protein
VRYLSLACLAALAVVLGACSGPRRDSAENAAACGALAKVLSEQEQGFVNQAQSIRARHLLLQEYDREMITAITERRKAIQQTKLTELSVSDEVSGCSGPRLDELRYRAQQEMANLRDFLNDFNRALKTDPADIFIDAP